MPRHTDPSDAGPARLAREIAARVGRAQTDRIVRVVEGLDLEGCTGEVVGLVGESGCGKSTLERLVAGFRREVLFRGRDIALLPRAEAGAASLNVRMILLGPYASLNPRPWVADIVGEAPPVHRMVGRADLAS